METKSIRDNFFYEKFGKDKPKNDFPSSKKIWLYGLIFFVLIICYWLVFSAPSSFPSGKIISIPSGTSLKGAGEILEKDKIIRSSATFKLAVRFFDGAKGVKAGNYLFDSPQNVIKIAKRLTEGERGFAPVRVVIPEGTSSEEIAQILENKIPNFDKKEFLKLALKYEGYLFPDTYTFMFDATSQSIIDTFIANFDKKIESLDKDIKKFNRPIVDIIKMASIVEEEGRTFETRRIVAGILWKRIDIGMPLQVDAAFKYENGKTTKELTTEDLKKDSPYNTYTRKELPPTPITNPGLDAIKATIMPIESDYLFYLTDNNGKMRYARTHEEHVRNKEIYLR